MQLSGLRDPSWHGIACELSWIKLHARSAVHRFDVDMQLGRCAGSTALLCAQSH